MLPRQNRPKNSQGSATRPRWRDRDARERALLAAARKLFASQGYAVTTTREIAAEAGCAEGLIHRYFHGKAGLILTIIRNRAGQESVDVNLEARQATTAKAEILHLVEGEVDRMWSEREFLQVVLPTAVVDPALGDLIGKTDPMHRAKAIAKRLKSHDACRHLHGGELQSLADFVGAIAFMFGFLHPAVLRQDRERAKRMAARLTKILVRNLSPVG